MRNLEEQLSRLISALEVRLTMPRREWFSIKEAAELTGLSSDHMRRAVVGGTLPARNQGSSSRPLYRISREKLNVWMAEREMGPKPPPGRRKKKREELKPLPQSKHFRQRSTA